MPRPSTGWPWSGSGAPGFRGYEISNWARPGHESRHNLVYWRREPYEAVGRAHTRSTGSRGAGTRPGWTGTWPRSRRAPRRSRRRCPRRRPPADEVVDADAAAAEAVILGLRLDEGLARDDAERGPLAPHLGLGAGQRVSWRPCDTPAGERVRLTTEGRLLSNELFARLV